MEQFDKILKDLLERAFRSGKPYFSEFLSREKTESLAIRGEYRLLGGFEGSERVVFAALPGSDFPIEEENVLACVRVIPNDGGAYSHRDYLGSILALGIKRESVGDIVVTDSDAYVVTTPAMAKYIRENLGGISRTGAKTLLVPLSDIPTVERNEETLTFSVSSLRLDCVLSAVFDLGRSDAKSYCEKGLCSVNRAVCQKSEKLLSSGDSVSLKGWGRFRLDGESGLSKKGKIRLNVTKNV